MLNRFPEVGDVVKCPPDRGAPGYTGHVTHVSHDVARNASAVPYVWCEVIQPGAHRTMWPSNRLGYSLPADAKGL